MKKTLFITLFITVLAVMLFCIPTMGVAFADGEVTVTYIYNGEQLYMSTVAAGTEITQPLLYNTLSQSTDLSGKEITVKTGSETGETVVFPYKVNEDTTFYVVLEDTTETCTFTYIYNYRSNESYDKIEKEFLKGSAIEIINSIDSYRIEDFYSSPDFKSKTHPIFATNDQTLYVKLNKNVTFHVNGKEITAPHGASLIDVTRDKTQSILNFYYDQSKTKKYTVGVAVDGLDLYGDYVTTHFAVTFQNENQSKVVYVPIGEDGHALVDESYFPQDPGIAAAEWRINEKESPSYPYDITGDTTLYASNGMRYTIDNNDRAILHPILFVLIAIIVWGSVYEHIKTKRKKKAAQEAQAAEQEPSAAENAEDGTGESQAEDPGEEVQAEERSEENAGNSDNSENSDNANE